MSGNGSEAKAGTSVSLPEVMSTLGHELRMLSDGVTELQDLIGDMVASGELGGAASIYELQCLDRLAQSLGAVAEFVDGIGRQSSADWHVDRAEASRDVKLAELSKRLNGAAASDDDSETGVFEGFDDWAKTG